MTYDEAINNTIEKEYPEYYSALLEILDDFELELISKKVIAEDTYENYVKVLNEICRDSTYRVVNNFALGDSLTLNSKRYNFELINIMKTVPLINYRIKVQAKSIIFNQRASEITANKRRFSRSDYASLLLEVDDDEDFQLPTIRTQLYRFLDPNTDYLLHILLVNLPKMNRYETLIQIKILHMPLLGMYPHL